MDILEIPATDVGRLEQIVAQVGWKMVGEGDVKYIEGIPGIDPVEIDTRTKNFTAYKVYVAKDGGKIIGLMFVKVYRNGQGIEDYAEIKYLRSFQERQGTGRALVRALQEKDGMEAITLTALDESSYGFYDKMGFPAKGHISARKWRKI